MAALALVLTFIIGLALVVLGVWMKDEAIGVIVAGLLLTALSVIVHRGKP